MVGPPLNTNNENVVRPIRAREDASLKKRRKKGTRKDTRYTAENVVFAQARSGIIMEGNESLKLFLFSFCFSHFILLNVTREIVRLTPCTGLCSSASRTKHGSVPTTVHEKFTLISKTGEHQKRRNDPAVLCGSTNFLRRQRNYELYRGVLSHDTK